MISASGLTKRFGETLAVDDVSFEVAPGQVVGFLGRNGAGKTTTLRMLLGLVRPTSGRCEILDRPVAELERPARHVGFLLEAGAHPGRTARHHLRVCAATAGVEEGRIAPLLEEVSLTEAADRRAGELSQGMRQRLGIAAALLAEPEVLLLDEPANGLDPDGIRWLRSLLRRLADEGRTVLVSSHQLAEVTESADHVLVMEAGQLVAECSLPELLRRAGSEVVVRSPGAEALAEHLRRSGVASARFVRADELRARDVAPSVVTELAASCGLPVSEVRSETPSLEDVFFELTGAAGASNGEGAAAGHPHDELDGGREWETGRLADAERRLERELANQPAFDAARVVAVLAPGEGLGRTTISLLLGDVIAGQLGVRTLVASLSVDRERVRLPVPPEQRSKLGLEDLLGDLGGFDEAARMSPYVSVGPSGVHTLSGPEEKQSLEQLGGDDLERLLGFAVRFYDVIVLDVGDLNHEALHRVVRRADEVLLVGSPDAVDRLAAPSAVIDAVESLRSDPATLVLNRVDRERAVLELTNGRPAGAHVVVPEDRELIRALDSGEFRLADADAATRAALKRLGLVVVEGLQ